MTRIDWARCLDGKREVLGEILGSLLEMGAITARHCDNSEGRILDKKEGYWMKEKDTR